SSGPFRYTRNPMYVALMLLYVAGVLAIGNVWVAILLLPVFLALHYGVIIREERYLKAEFGGQYEEYQGRVRRWIEGQRVIGRSGDRKPSFGKLAGGERLGARSWQPDCPAKDSRSWHLRGIKIDLCTAFISTTTPPRLYCPRSMRRCGRSI